MSRGTWTVRAARSTDVPHLQDVERAAGQAFRAIGMDSVADDPPPAQDVLTTYVRGGRAWVAVDATDPRDVPVGYLLVDVVDGAAHVEQVSVHPEHAGQRLGSALIDQATRWAREQQLAAVTLTTFADVPWNAPYYARLGFRPVPESELGEGMVRVRQVEAQHGLDRWRRCVMRRPVETETA